MADKDDKDGKSGGGGGGGDKSTVRQVVAEVLGELFRDGKADVADKDSDKGGGGRGRREDTGDVASQVEAAVKRVRDKDARDKAEREREERLTALEEKLAKPEKIPAQVRRATRLMWGGGDDD